MATLNPPIRHVLFVTDAFHPETGGVERVCFELAKAYVRKSVRVTVLARAVDGRPAREIVEDIRVCRYPYSTRFAPAVYLSHYRSSSLMAERIVSGGPPDLAHLHLPLSAQGPLNVLAHRRIPVVASFYGPWHKEFLVESEDLLVTRGSLYRRYLHMLTRFQKAMQRRLLRRAAGIVVLSEFSRNELLELAPWAGPKTVKIPGGIDPDIFHPADGEKETDGSAPKLFTARRLVRRTGVDLLLDALAILLKNGRRARLVIAGQGPMAGELKEQAERLHIADMVRFSGFVPDEDLAGLFSECDLFVIPTREQENFGLPILEAAACACPVAATPVGSIPEVMAAAGSPYLAARTDAASLAFAIERALEGGAEARSRLLKNARAVAERYAWDAVAEAHLDHYGKVMACASR